MKHKSRLTLLVLFVCVACRYTPTYSQISSVDGPQQFADLGDFKLHDGGVIHEFRLGYRTLGKLNATK